MPYYLDLESMSLDNVETLLVETDLIKSRLLLKEGIGKKFSLIKESGISDGETLFKTLKNKKKLQDLSAETGIDENYLSVLIRELKGYRQKPVKITDFPEIGEKAAQSLEGMAIKNTLQLYEHILTEPKRKDLSEKTGLSLELIETLAKLTDLSRIRWVNHTFAWVLYRTGYETALQVAEADFEKMHEKINALNDAEQIYKGHIGLHDMKLTVETASLLPAEIQI